MEDYMEKLRKELGGLLREKLTGSGLRQIDLARELLVTPAAVSQMLNGKITPNIVQLQKLSEKLNCTRSEYSHMQDLLTNIKSRGRLGLSYLNYELRRARRERNMSLAELSRQTGVPVNDIKLYENSPCLEPERQELSRLCKALGLNVGSFIQVEYPTARTPSPVLSVREEPDAYCARAHIPQLELKKLKKFRPGVSSIDAFVLRQSTRNETFSALHFSEKMFAATATAAELPLFDSLDAVLILLKAYAKDGDVVLAHLDDGGFTLRRYRRKDSKIILEPMCGGSETLILEEDETQAADFIIPVAEIIFNTGRTS